MADNKYAGKKCFVIMPFGVKKEIDFNHIYHELIKPAVEELGVECERCDEIVDSGSIHKKMFRGIFDADVSVVDITLEDNLNVFYELGIRHALHKNVTVVIGKKSYLQKIPFNINGLNILEYEIDTDDQIQENRKRIREHIQRGLEDNKAVDSIVHDALPDLSIGRTSKTIDAREEKLYKLLNVPGKEIGFITGNIKNIKNVDVWVNSENTNMLMARHFERSISATIRYGGAKKDRAGYVIEDLIADDLREATGGRDATPGAVIPTTAGMLEKSNNVKVIFHAAAVIGQPGVGYMPINNIADCIRNAMALADSEEMQDKDIQSILFPLMGTGTTRMSAQDTADNLIDAAVCYFEDNPNSRLNKVYFLAYSEQDREICRHKFVTDPKIATPGETEPSEA